MERIAVDMGDYSAASLHSSRDRLHPWSRRRRRGEYRKGTVMRFDHTLQREPSIASTTFGSWIDHNQERLCDTLEDVVRVDPDPSTPHNEAKVYGETAIPEGTYKIDVVQWSKFGPDSMVLLNVPGFQGIFIHGGFDDEHTHGCILVGHGRVLGQSDGGDLTPGSSKQALAELKSHIVPLIRDGHEVWLTVKGAS